MPDVQEVFRMATQKVHPDPGALERQNRTQQRRGTMQRVGGYTLLAILVIAAAVISVVTLRPPEQQPADQPDGQPSAAELATKPYFLDLWTGKATLLPESLAGGYSYVASPDRTKLAYFGSGNTGAITVASIDGTILQTLQPPEGFRDLLPRWSPDGTKIVYQERLRTSSDHVGNLFVEDLSTGEKTQITDLDLQAAYFWDLSPRFTLEGDRVIFHLPRSSSQTTKWDVWQVRATGGEPRLLLRNASFAMFNPFPLHDGFAMQFLRPSANDLTGRSIMTGHPCCDASRQTVVEANNAIWWPTMSPDGQRIAYRDGVAIYVVEVKSGESSEVARGEAAEWLDNDTLIVSP